MGEQVFACNKTNQWNDPSGLMEEHGINHDPDKISLLASVRARIVLAVCDLFYILPPGKERDPFREGEVFSEQAVKNADKALPRDYQSFCNWWKENYNDYQLSFDENDFKAARAFVTVVAQNDGWIW